MPRARQQNELRAAFGSGGARAEVRREELFRFLISAPRSTVPPPRSVVKAGSGSGEWVHSTYNMAQ